MGQGIVTSDEIVEKNLLQNTIDQYAALIVQIDKANTELNANAKAFSEVATAVNTKSKKSLNDLIAAYSKAKIVVEQSIKNDKAKVDATNQLVKAQLDAIKIQKAQEQLTQAQLRTAAQQEAALKREAAAKEKANKAAERAKQIILDESNAYKKLTSETNKAQAEFKQLAAQYGTTSRQAKAALDKFERLDNALRKVNDAARDGRRDVGRYGLAWKEAQSTLSKFGVGISIGFIAREGIQAITEYEDAVAKFRTIVSDLSDTEFSKFQNEITNVANTTKLSTTEIASSFETIAGLNAEFAKTSEGIGNVSEAVATLAKASKGELQPTAENLVGIMNQFDLAANQADRTINVLAAGQAVGAASIAQSSEAYKNFGSVAKSANIDLEKSQALIQTVAKFSIFGAEAGTKLRGVTLKLQQANLGYQSGQFNINDALKEYNEQLAKKTSAQDKDALASEVFGAENITVGKILANNIPLIEKFEKGVTGTSEAQKAAAINSDTLSNRWEELKDSATTLLTTNRKVGWGLNLLKGGLKLLADNLGLVVSMLTKAVIAFGTFKAVMLGIRIADRIKEWRSFRKEVADGAKAANEASEGTKRFGQALKGAITTAVIALVMELAMAWLKVASGAKQAKEFVDAYNASADKQGEVAQKNIDKINKQAQAEINAIKLRKLSAAEEAKLINDVNKRTEQQLKSFQSATKARLYEQAELLKQLKAQRQELYDQTIGGKEALDIVTANASYGLGATTPTIQRYIYLNKLITSVGTNVAGAGAKFDAYGQAVEGVGQELLDFQIAEGDAAEAVESGTGKIKERTKEVKELDESYKDLEDSIRSLESAQVGAQVEDVSTNIDDELQKQIDQATKTGKFETDLFRKLIKDKYDLRVRDSEDIRDFEKMQAERDIKDKALLAVTLERIEFDHQQRLKAAEIEGKKERNDGLKQLDEAQMQYFEQSNKDEIEAEKDKNEELYNAYKNFQEALTEVLKEQIDARIDALKKEEDAAKNRQDFYEELAAQGNITAQQSITKQIELQDAAQEEQARLEAMKQRVEAISAGLKTYTALLEEGKTPTQALTGALTTTEVLASILKNIPFFADGTDNAPEGWAVVDDGKGAKKGREAIFDKKGNLKEIGTNKGARFTYLNQGDIVKSAPETANLLNRFDQIEMGRIVNNQKDTAGNSFDLLPIQNELKGIRADLTKTQTKYEANWEGLADVLPHFIVTRTKGGDKRTDRYTVR